jgi:hypothetical protein
MPWIRTNGNCVTPYRLKARIIYYRPCRHRASSFRPIGKPIQLEKLAAMTPPALKFELSLSHFSATNRATKFTFTLLTL